jgi:hypothetical protein
MKCILVSCSCAATPAEVRRWRVADAVAAGLRRSSGQGWFAAGAGDAGDLLPDDLGAAARRAPDTGRGDPAGLSAKRGPDVTVPGLVAATSAPSTIAVAGGRDRRLELCVLIALMGLANLASAAAPSFAVPATVLIVGGVSAASALGVPLGTMTGEIDGWRSAFAALGGFAIARPPRRTRDIDAVDPPRVRTLLT